MLTRSLAIAAGFLFALTAAEASVRVSPVLVEVRAPAGAATLTLKNDDARPVQIQIRLFRWTQIDGEERLERTPDVVVSPPFATLLPGAEYVVRVVRVTTQPVSAEESYRVIVDEVPDRAMKHNGIHFALRYSIPVFFSTQAGEAALAWSARRDKAGLVLAAQNSGSRRLRLSNLRLLDRRGRTVSEQAGLVGYVLAGAAMRWNISAPGVRLGDQLRLLAESDQRPVDATLRLAPAR
jgi:fimbrial chaperone protein